MQEENVLQKLLRETYEPMGYKILPQQFAVQDDEGYLYQSSSDSFLQGKLPSKFGTRNTYFEENIKLLLKKNNSKTILIKTKSVKMQNKKRLIITLKCGNCGTEYDTTIDHLVPQKQYVCSACKKAHQNDGIIKKTNERYKKDLARQGFEMIDNTKLYKANDNVPIRELSTGYLGYVYASHIGHIKKMLVFSEYFNLDNYIYNVKQYIKNNNISTKCLGFSDKTDNNSQRNHKLVRFQCSCGEIFETTIFHFMNGKTRCDVCQSRISTNELKVRQFLEDNHIDFVREYRIEACRDLTVLPFDFQLTKTKQLIEIDGEQHFKPTRFGGMSIEEAQSEFEQTQKRDKIKNNFCKQHNIPLLRIPYWDIDNDNYKQLILDYINTAQN